MPIFPGGGGGLAPAGLPSYSVFVSPTGSDSAQGSQGSPFKTMYAATRNVIQNGGGTINFADNVTVGGPVSGQGLWLRNDGIAVPGFLDMDDRPLFFLGNGQASAQGGNSVFQRPAGAQMIGGSLTDFTKPGLWICASEIPVTVQYMLTRVGQFGNVVAPVRLGWDYARKANFALEAITVSSATRTGTASVYSIDVSSATAWVVTHASRDADDNVTLVLTKPATVAMSPWTVGTKIRVNTSADADFPNVDATVTAQSDGLSPQTDASITVTYVQAGATISKNLAGTVKSHGLQAGDRLMTSFSGSAHFATCCQMLVTAATIDTVTVFDPSAAGNATDASPGTITKQVRGRMVADAVDFDYCTFFGQTQTNDDAAFGPTVDMGGTSAVVTNFNTCYIGGGLAWNWQGASGHYDPDRTNVAILADPGAGTLSGASLQFSNCQSQSGSVRWYPHSTEASIVGVRWLQDSGGGAFSTVICGDGNSFATINLHQIANADAGTSAVDIGTGYDFLKAQIGDIYSACQVPVTSRSAITGPRNIRAALWEGGSCPSPWALAWRTSWPAGLTTPHVGVNRAFGVVQNRFTNLFPSLDDWDIDVAFPAGITVSTGSTAAADLAPDGSPNAIKIVASGAFVDGLVRIGLYPGSLNAAIGDWVVLGMWFRSGTTPGIGSSISVAAIAPGDVEFSGLDNIRASRHIGTGVWQWCATYAQVTGISGSGHFTIALSIPAVAATHYVYAPYFALVPQAVGQDDFYEYAGTFKHGPQYLPKGIAGTMENVKLIAHGGIGMSAALAKTVGVASGQLTLTGSGTTYVPVYAADGVTIQGWVAQLQATVNP